MHPAYAATNRREVLPKRRTKGSLCTIRAAVVWRPRHDEIAVKASRQRITCLSGWSRQALQVVQSRRSPRGRPPWCRPDEVLARPLPESGIGEAVPSGPEFESQCTPRHDAIGGAGVFMPSTRPVQPQVGNHPALGWHTPAAAERRTLAADAVRGASFSKQARRLSTKSFEGAAAPLRKPRAGRCCRFMLALLRRSVLFPLLKTSRPRPLQPAHALIIAPSCDARQPRTGGGSIRGTPGRARNDRQWCRRMDPSIAIASRPGPSSVRLR